MPRKDAPKSLDILPVTRSKEQARQFYDRISRVYDYFTGLFERRYAERAVDYLSVKPGETALEIGFGPGHCLKRLAGVVGPTGRVYGVDISEGMLAVASKRLAKAGLTDRVKLHCGDAAGLPYADSSFDAAFMSYTLELLDTPEIPALLGEIGRVVKPRGRVAVVAMSKEDGGSLLLGLYEWAHRQWPGYVDCRPIYPEQSLREAGFGITKRERMKVFGCGRSPC